MYEKKYLFSYYFSAGLLVTMIALALAIDRNHTNIPFVASSSILTIIIFTHKKH
ncbi:hypothetical protein [Bacillus sp. 71mf]|uniref:hypothetical protein n=1 Tax=Bacillus sp. 71mf TaxID=1761757 RepID=UPI001587660D|nr:hypothetical protein [Bacillus sp. 71mf]